MCHECTLTSIKCLLRINKNHIIILLNYGKVLNFIVWFLNVKRFSNISQSVSSVAPSCPTLCDPKHCSFLVLHYLQSLLKLKSIELVMPSNDPNLCCPLLLLSLIFPNIRVFSNELVLCTR